MELIHFISKASIYRCLWTIFDVFRKKNTVRSTVKIHIIHCKLIELEAYIVYTLKMCFLYKGCFAGAIIIRYSNKIKLEASEP